MWKFQPHMDSLADLMIENDQHRKKKSDFGEA